MCAQESETKRLRATSRIYVMVVIHAEKRKPLDSDGG